MVRRSQIVETKFIKWLFLSVSALAILFAPDSAVSIWFKRASDTGVDVNVDKNKK
jgi:bacteriorhodopsin